MTNAKFEEGKTYFIIWNEEDGRPHTSKYTVEKRTAKTVVINGSRSKIGYCDWANCEVAKVGYGKFVYAKDVFGEDTVKAQAEKDAWWDEQDQIANQRTIELNRKNAAEAVASTDAQDAEIEAETELANNTQETVAQNPVEVENTALENFKAELKADGYKFVVTINNVFFGENNSTSIMPTNTYVKTYEKALAHLERQAEFYAENPAHDGGFELATIDDEVLAKGDKTAEYEQSLNSVETPEVEDTDDKLIDPPIKKSNREKFLRARKVVSYKCGRELKNGKFAKVWLCKNCLEEFEKTNRATVIAILKEFDLTLEEFITEQELWVAEGIARGAAQMAIDVQANFLKDQIAREVKPCDDNNEVFNYLPAIDNLNDVDENTVAQVKIDNAQSQDEFHAELAKLKTAADEAYATFVKAQEAHEQTKNALKNFLDDTAFKLKQKLDALPLNYTITLKKRSGTTYRVADFSEIYIGAYHLGCDVEFRFENWAGRRIVHYETPAQVENVINQLKEAIKRGDKEFTFPTVDELNITPEMPPRAPKSPDNNAEDILPINDETPPQIAYDAQIAHINKIAPKNWNVSFDAVKNNFPVKFKDKTIVTLDSLALTKFLTPEQFFAQFKTLVDKNYSPKEQFLDDRRKELDALLDMRKLITDDNERLKTIDDMINSIKRDLLETYLE